MGPLKVLGLQKRLMEVVGGVGNRYALHASHELGMTLCLCTGLAVSDQLDFMEKAPHSQGSTDLAPSPRAVAFAWWPGTSLGDLVSSPIR